MTFNREHEVGLVHVIGFQGRQWGGRFTINLGIYVREIDVIFDDWWGRQSKARESGRDGSVREEVCLLRARLGRLGPEGDRETSGGATTIRHQLRPRSHKLST